MRYWVYINDKVEGPYEEDKLASLDGFTPDTLICSEEIEEGGSQEWVKASNIFEFDEATKTMTRGPLTQEELDTIRGNTSDINTAPPVQTAATPDASATQILIEKIDYLTREIESLKTKLDAALAASHSAAPAAAANSETAPTEQPAAETVTEEALITNTASLVNHAEQVVAQADSTSEKPVDFLDEIQIGAPKTENLSEKGGEEVVLRSALDSLYNVKPAEQTEEEKEATFQDLLSPLKSVQEEENSSPSETAAQEASGNANAEEPAPFFQQPDEQPQETQPVSEEKREEIINEITAPAQQDNLILQAVEEAQKEEQPQANLASLDSAPEQTPQTAAQQPAEEDLQLQVPTTENKEPENLPQQASAEKESLDLAGQPQLNIAGDEPEPQHQEEPQKQQEALNQPVSDQLTPMNPSDASDNEQKVVTETIKELVPGKKIEPQQQEEEGIISQADLDEAFTERGPAPEFPIPAEENKPENPNQETEIETPQLVQPQQPQQVQEVQQAPQAQPEQEPLAEHPVSNPNEMTEVELKEGSTYLISDFIPPETASGSKSSHSSLPKEYGAVPGSSEAAQAGAEGPSVRVQPITESVEEIIPNKKTDQADLTLSKVILENTIKTKRGATMDIKTVPMVDEPSDSQRLDLSEADLDINTQHDLKAADVKQNNNKLTKMVFGSAAAVVILALIYVMLGYLGLLPAGINFIKSEPAAEEQIQQNDQLNEMLPADASAPQQPVQGFAPQGQQQQPYGQPVTGYPANGQMPQQQGVLPQQGVMPQAQPATAGQMPMQQQQPSAISLDPILAAVKNLPLANGQTLEQLINSRHPAARGMIEWSITTAVEPYNYSVLVKVPPENPQSFKISHRFNYNTLTKVLSPTISDSKNLLDSITPQRQAVR